MRNWKTITHSGFLTLLFIILGLINIYAQENKKSENEILIVFNDSAARYVLENPQRAILEKQEIWDNFKGYQLVKAWHKKNNVPEINYIVHINEVLPYLFPNQDTSLIRNDLLKLMQNVQELERRNHDTISKHILSYLPYKRGYNANIYFVALSSPNAFSDKNNLVIEICNPNHKKNAGWILNLLIHEVFHVGFNQYKPDIRLLTDSTPTNKNMFIKNMYVDIQNEGMATYVGYKALELIPSTNKNNDYLLFENDSSIIEAISQVNALIERSKYESIDSLNKVAWDIGVSQRAYYLTGAYMSKIIEERLGREHLANLILKDSKVFFMEYNDLATKEYKINLLD